MPENIIVITGTPGTGKTTVSEKISKILNLKLINIAEFVKEKKLLIGYDKEMQSFIVDIEKARKYLEKITDDESTLFIIEGHVIDIIPAKRVRLCIVLRLNPRILGKRLYNRGYPKEKIMNNLESEVLDVLLIEALQRFGEEKVFEIDTSNLSIEEVVSRVLKIIKEGKNGRPGSVNWFEILGDEIDKYLIR